jgi:hypothetical protein
MWAGRDGAGEEGRPARVREPSRPLSTRFRIQKKKKKTQKHKKKTKTPDGRRRPSSSSKSLHRSKGETFYNVLPRKV